MMPWWPTPDTSQPIYEGDEPNPERYEQVNTPYATLVWVDGTGKGNRVREYTSTVLQQPTHVRGRGMESWDTTRTITPHCAQRPCGTVHKHIDQGTKLPPEPDCCECQTASGATAYEACLTDVVAAAPPWMR
uniref:Uncharacterized protein n=1 Tax=Oryza punctata TaxID=4537 RepID=A0A0E0KGR9_ORYPU